MALGILAGDATSNGGVMAMESSFSRSQEAEPRPPVRLDETAPDGAGLKWRFLVLAAAGGLAGWLLDADLSDSREVWLVLMGALWLAVLAVKGAGRV
jgi:fatty acid desaturase